VGFADERHLWPSFEWLILQRRPPVIFGEQVASKAVGPWIDLVHADVEAMGYKVDPRSDTSAGVGAPHIRDRLFWVADADDERLEGWEISVGKRTDKLTAWSDCVVIRGRDGSRRPIEPGTLPLADGSPGRVGAIRAYGNAICAPAAKEFIAAYIDAPVSG
jgi:DNA (cytosine-5)-methyltransferase 1